VYSSSSTSTRGVLTFLCVAASLLLSPFSLSAKPPVEYRWKKTPDSLALLLDSTDENDPLAHLRAREDLKTETYKWNDHGALDGVENLAIGAVASSPDDLEGDGAAGGDSAANDGDPNTYWDEQDFQKLYRLRITFPKPQAVNALSLLGYVHERYAPKDFEILCDNKTVKRVTNAKHTDNHLVVRFPATKCSTLELKITGQYGPSPAVREIGLYNIRPADESVIRLPNRPVDRVVWQFNFPRGKGGKPSFHPLTLGGGMNLTALAPADHIWHRGAWLSWKKINGLNYWEEDRAGRSQGETEVVASTITPNADFSAKLELTLSYHPPGKPTILTEQRVLYVSAPGSGGSYYIDWDSSFTSGDSEVQLDRTPIPGEPKGVGYGGYAGYSLRYAASTRQWTLLDSAGRTAEEKIHGQNALWVDFSGTTENGIEAGVAIFDHPTNRRHPSPWYVAKGMPYVSPAILFAEPLVLKPKETLRLKYRTLIHSGRSDAEKLKKAYEQFSTQ
jgi:hypothetical protein